MKPCKKKKGSKGRMDHRFVIVMSLGVLAAAVITALILYNRLSYSYVKLNDMLHVTYSGYNGNGEAVVKVVSPMEYSEFAKTVRPETDQSSGLSNGDTINIKWSYDIKAAKAQKLRIDDTTCRLSVSGLKKLKRITAAELFKNAEITENGISPYETVSVENTGSDDFFRTVKFSVEDGKKFYASGDAYTVTAGFDRKAAEKAGYEIEGTASSVRQSYNVKNGDTYITEAKDITADEIRQMDQTASSLFTDKKAKEYGLRIFREKNLMPVWSGSSTTFRWESPSLISVYFDIRKSDSSDNSVQKHINDVKLIYNAVLTQADGTSCNAEVIVRFEDLIRREDGTNDLNLPSGSVISASAQNANIKELISNEAGDYDIQAVNTK